MQLTNMEIVLLKVLYDEPNGITEGTIAVNLGVADPELFAKRDQALIQTLLSSVRNKGLVTTKGSEERPRYALNDQGRTTIGPVIQDAMAQEEDPIIR